MPPSHPGPSKLDLGSLRSFSPSWPFPIRLTLAIAVQYASQRCVQRAEAIHRSLNPAERATRGITAEKQKGADDEDDDLVERDDYGNIKARLEGWERKQRIRRDGEMVIAWREYAAKFVTATCQHLGISEDTLPPGPTTVEDIRSASRGRPTHAEAALVAPDYEWGSYHTVHSPLSKSLERGSRSHIDHRAIDRKIDELTLEEPVKVPEADKRSDVTDAQRSGGALDDESFKGRDMELANELILVALGLGQHRPEDGSTTLFEQEAIFGDVDSHPQSCSASSTAASNDTKNQEPQETPSRGSDFGSRMWESAASSLGVASKTVKEQLKSTDTKSRAPLKPNEPCHYDARARAIIFVAISAMAVKGQDICMAEKVIAQTIYFILSEGRTQSEKQGKGDPLHGRETDQSRQSWMNTASQGAVSREKSRSAWGRYLATGAGVAVGGAIIGLTGGLAAPIVAPALVGLTGGFAFLATTGGIVMIGTLLGVTGGGLAGYRVQRRLRGIDYFEFEEVRSAAREAGVTIPSLHATICCSGLLLRTDEQGAVFKQVFHKTSDARDIYTVRAEEKMMQDAGEGLKGYVVDTAIRAGGQRVGTEVLKHTALAGFAALALPLTVWSAASAALDSLFVQAKSRAYRAGLILADVLRNEVQGHRPVMLVGTSLGCVTILTALGELAKTPEECLHLVDSVFLIGAPITPSPGTLRRARSVTARRFVNAYTCDMVCSIAAWLGSGISLEELRGGMMPRVMGSQAVLDVPGVENIDIGDLVKEGHFALNQASVLHDILNRCRALE